MNISCRIANADTQCGQITNPPERVTVYSSGRPLRFCHFAYINRNQERHRKSQQVNKSTSQQMPFSELAILGVLFLIFYIYYNIYII